MMLPAACDRIIAVAIGWPEPVEDIIERIIVRWYRRRTMYRTVFTRGQFIHDIPRSLFVGFFRQIGNFALNEYLRFDFVCRAVGSRQQVALHGVMAFSTDLRFHMYCT